MCIGGSLQRPVILVGTTERLFVRRNDVNAPRQPVSVSRTDRLACRTVDDDRMRQVIRIDVRFEVVEVEIHCLVPELVLPFAEPDSSVAKQHRFRPRDRPYAQINVEVIGQPLTLLFDLSQQGATNSPRADQADR